MDKKKVKELIERGISYLNRSSYITSYKDDARECFKEAINELSKSDWVSVEDRQPPKNAVVRVCNKQDTDGLVLAYRTSQETMKIVYPSNIAIYNITHWKPIEKLEERV